MSRYTTDRVCHLENEIGKCTRAPARLAHEHHRAVVAEGGGDGRERVAPALDDDEDHRHRKLLRESLLH